MTSPAALDRSYDTAIAIIGMAGRFPDAPSVEAFWQNIASGVRSIRTFSEAELTVRAYAKHPDDVTIPACYCFAVSAGAMNDAQRSRELREMVAREVLAGSRTDRLPWPTSPPRCGGRAVPRRPPETRRPCASRRNLHGRRQLRVFRYLAGRSHRPSTVGGS